MRVKNIQNILLSNMFVGGNLRKKPEKSEILKKLIVKKRRKSNLIKMPKSKII